MKSTSRMFKALLAWILLLVFALTGQALAQGGTWETKAPMPTARYGQAAGVIGGKLYVASGCCVVFDAFPFTRFTALEVYDPATDTWDTTKAPIPTAIYGAAVGVIGGKLYVAGGQAIQSEGLNIATLQVYDPATDTWDTTKAPMPFGSSAMTAGVIGGKLYVAGGTNTPNTGIVNTLRVYDPATDTWDTTKAPMPTARAFAGGGVVNGILYAMGGGTGTGSILATVEAYDPATDTWDTTRAPMPTPRFGQAVEMINGILYAVGGYNGSFLATVEAYDSVADTWTAQAPMPTARNLPAVGVVNGILYTAGGQTPAPSFAVATLEAFTPVIQVAIDIKPGTFPNSINPKSKGKIPVAILTTDTFDAATVDPTTILFGPTGTEAAPVHPPALEDVDGDGDADLILHFNTQDTGIVCGDTSASLTGESLGGQMIEGSDSVNTVGCK